MSTRYQSVERNLKRTAARWKWLRLLQHTATIGTVVCLLALLLGAGMISGRMTDRHGVIGLCVLLTIAVLAAWVVVALKILSEDPDRNWLAGKIESVNFQFLDRLNTLLFLEKWTSTPWVHSFSSRIARQTRDVLARQPARSPFSSARPLAHLLVFAVLLGTTIFVYQRYSPWQKLLAAEQQKKLAGKKEKEEQPLPEIAPPENSLVETNRLWGEIRITDPGRDLQVTKLQVVPLQIEAAANEPLRTITWRSAINEGLEQIHELPAPEDPRYAAYKPEVDLLKLGLSEWDVLTYYARADTTSGSSYASEVYFLEVRPSYEEIQKIPGGKGGGGGYGFLKKLTELIRQQQQIIRETYHHVHQTPVSADLQAQDRKKLADGESDLGESVDHLAAEMAAALGRERIAGVLEDLAQAREPLTQASGSLRSNLMDDAQKQERDALQRLVATRKHFQKAVSENPDAFGEESDPLAEDRPMPNDLSSTNKLNQITEFRNEAKAAQDFLDKAVQQQQDIAQRAGSRAVDPRLAQEERELQQSVERFLNDHPPVFQNLERESAETKQSLASAAESLQKKSKDAPNQTQQVAQKLENLAQAFKKQAAARQLTDAYELKKMLDRQIQALGQCEQSPGSLSGSQASQLGTAAKATLTQLKNLAEQPPTRDAFSPPLRESLNDKNKADLDTRLSRFALAQGDQARSQSARAAKEGLEKVSQAFEQSQPESLKAAQKSDPFKPDGQNSLPRSLAQLEQLIQQWQNDRALSPKDQAQQGLEALANLRQNLDDLKGSNDRLQALLARLEEQLKKPEPAPNATDFEKLLQELQRISAEASERQAAKAEKPKLKDIDPARLPPAYRSRIEKYFEKLSER